MRTLIGTELRKLASVRSTWILLAATALLAGLHAAGLLIGDPGGQLTADIGKQRVLFSAGMGSILAIVLGVLISAGEFRHGTITDTYLTTPRRGRVLTAKIAAGLATGAAAGLASAATTLAVSASWLSATGEPLPMDERFVWLTLLGGLLWCTTYAVIGVAVGALTRNPVLGIVGALAWLYVIEGIVVSAFEDVGRWLPSGAASAVGNAVKDGLLPQWGGLAMLGAYATVIAGIAGLTTLRRDVT
ncbi:ABC transporter permease subunit [Streptomyces ovatisporus]|uniref:ABC transporter permease subunit n=1 Tax=Streptomyces ovatisporus TaxID=1128682 RepID=A0ABV9A8K9_9ACTN